MSNKANKAGVIYTELDNGAFWRDEFGAVHINPFFRRSPGYAANELLATLPAGFRPRKDVYVPAFLGASGYYMGALMVNTQGQIILYINTSPNRAETIFGATIEYLAADD